MANTDKIVGGVNITELANKLRSGETTIAQASSTSAVDKKYCTNKYTKCINC